LDVYGRGEKGAILIAQPGISRHKRSRL